MYFSILFSAVLFYVITSSISGSPLSLSNTNTNINNNNLQNKNNDRLQRERERRTIPNDNPQFEIVRCIYQTFNYIAYDEKCSRIKNELENDVELKVTNNFDPNSPRNTQSFNVEDRVSCSVVALDTCRHNHNNPNANTVKGTRNGNKIEINFGCTLPGESGGARRGQRQMNFNINGCTSETPHSSIPAYPVYYYTRRITF
eukprot:Pgem_evm1s2766